MAPWARVGLAGLLLAGCAAAPGRAAPGTVTATEPNTPMTPDEMRAARPLPLPGARGGPARPQPETGGPQTGAPSGLSPGGAGDPVVPDPNGEGRPLRDGLAE